MPENIIRNEYESRGTYHSALEMSPQWLPRYFRRLYIAEKFLSNFLDKSASIVDIGCGEGVFIKEMQKLGFKNIFGVDANISATDFNLLCGNVTGLPIKSESIDAVTCMDMLEHVPLNFQKTASTELFRILKPGGVAIVSVPNMAHLKSRFQFLFSGKPWRNKFTKHPGELSIYERIEILEKAGLICKDKLGLHLTLSYNPAPKGIARFLNRIMFSPRVPFGLCWTVVLLMYKKPEPPWMVSLSRNYAILKKILQTYRPGPEDPTSDSFYSQKR